MNRIKYLTSFGQAMTIDTANRNEPLRNLSEKMQQDLLRSQRIWFKKPLMDRVANISARTAALTVNLPFKSTVLRRRNQWDNLFKGFIKMKAISFVVQPVFLLEYFDNRDYESIELLVGKGLTEQYKDKMVDTKWQTIERLHSRVDSEELILWGNKRLSSYQVVYSTGC